jgi:hypothetical protein
MSEILKCMGQMRNNKKASYTVDTRGSFLGIKRPGCEADTRLLVPESKMCGAIPSLPQYTVIAWC